MDPFRIGDQLLLLPPVRPLGERLGHEFFRTVPKRPGVYLMCGPGDGVLYVGKAKNLNQRLGSYRSANTERLPRKLRRLLLAVERIHWDECPDEAAALERERVLLLTLKPRFNTAGVYPAPALRLGWSVNHSSLRLGLDASAESFAQRGEPSRKLRPAYAALLRLLWGAGHSDQPLQSMPARLVSEKPPVAWEYNPGFLSEAQSLCLNDLLSAFFQARSVQLVDWLIESRKPACPFEQSWQTQDADCLREFAARKPERV